MKRTWPETLGMDHLRRNADSPDANNVPSDDSSLADITMQSIKVPLKDGSDFPKTPQDATISIPPLRKNGLGGDPSSESVVGESVIDDQLNKQQPAPNVDDSLSLTISRPLPLL